MEKYRHRGRRRCRIGRAEILRGLDARRAAGIGAPRGHHAGLERSGGGSGDAGIRDHRPLSAAWGVEVTVAIVDYGSGNLHSAAKAFERAAREQGATVEIAVTRDPDLVRRADRIVLP